MALIAIRGNLLHLLMQFHKTKWAYVRLLENFQCSEDKAIKNVPAASQRYSAKLTDASVKKMKYSAIQGATIRQSATISNN